MDDRSHRLEEPAVSYGRKVRLGDIAPQPLENMEETLRERGYISYEELAQHLSKYQ
ncbi:MAG: hypothetical protein IJT74_02415 [Bacteroidales bacterium]|nr:hypothetical protein [Bacteroidales bacterium]